MYTFLIESLKLFCLYLSGYEASQMLSLKKIAKGKNYSMPLSIVCLFNGKKWVNAT